MNIVPSLTVLLLFACLVAYEYIRDLRRDLKSAREDAKRAWKIYERTNNDLLTLQGKPVPTEPFFPEEHKPPQDDEKRSRGFRPGRVGPSAILDREMEEGRIDGGMRTPAGYPATQEQVLAAIKDAKNNGELR